ncbi:hypothetical protein M0813_16504 [Anaeramoeba flamelloides]|uniref:Uncharacterized protein n=1 Tax=Anaeramoeba flamelloides TaxID=1746091 RepID=A0ABQ8YZ47_9EUKA|nr:hypothetical protein M0813_16504 [Anaeramoeba flamelloides]
MTEVYNQTNSEEGNFAGDQTTNEITMMEFEMEKRILEHKIKELERENNRFKKNPNTKRLESLEKKNYQMKEIINMLENTIEDKNQELKVAKMQLESKLEEIVIMQELAEKEKKKSSDEIKELEEEIEKLKTNPHSENRSNKKLSSNRNPKRKTNPQPNKIGNETKQRPRRIQGNKTPKTKSTLYRANTIQFNRKNTKKLFNTSLNKQTNPKTQGKKTLQPKKKTTLKKTNNTTKKTRMKKKTNKNVRIKQGNKPKPTTKRRTQTQNSFPPSSIPDKFKKKTAKNFSRNKHMKKNNLTSKKQSNDIKNGKEKEELEKIKSLEEKLKQITEKSIQTEKNLKRLLDVNKKLNRIILENESKGSNSGNTEEIEKMKKHYEKNIEKLKSQLRKLLRELKSTHQKNNEFLIQIQQDSKKKTQLQQRNLLLQNQINKLRSDNANLEKKIKKLPILLKAKNKMIEKQRNYKKKSYATPSKEKQTKKNEIKIHENTNNYKTKLYSNDVTDQN